MMLTVFCRFDIFFRFCVKGPFASGRAEIIGLPLVFRFTGSSFGVNIHTTYGIFKHGCYLLFGSMIATSVRLGLLKSQRHMSHGKTSIFAYNKQAWQVL